MNNTNFTKYDSWLMDAPETESYFDDLGNELYANDTAYDIDGTWVSEEEVEAFIDSKTSQIEEGIHETYNGEMVDAEEYSVMIYEDIIYIEDDTQVMINHFFPKNEAEEVLMGE